MATMKLKTCIFSLFLLLIFIAPLPSSSSSPDDICSLTPLLSFCKSILPNAGSPASSINDYLRLFIQRSLSTTKFFISLVNLQLGLINGVLSEKTTIQALQDCVFLSNLNVDFLSETLETIFSSNSFDRSRAEYFHTILSATLTNQQTCLDGLETDSSSSIVRNALLDALNRLTMIYRVVLALFKHGWVDESGGEKGTCSSHRDFSLSKVNVSQMVVVDPKGSGNFTTINDAVAAAPDNTAASGGKSYFVIYVVAGVYEEYVSISSRKQNLMMIGDGIDRTIITGNRSVVDGWTTFNSATFAVVGKGFTAINITFRNTAGPAKHQAVAVRNGADKSTFYSCSFEGYQDTLYAHSLRQFYRNCNIYGTVDFIFGDAVAVFQRCNILARLPMQKQFNAITAQGRSDANQNSGTSIQDCVITAARDLALFNNDNSNNIFKTFLGRPWKEHSRTVFMQSFIDDLVDPAGWKAWDGGFALDTLYYGEYDNTGPGSDTKNRVTWPGYHRMNAMEADNFTVAEFLVGDEWLPPTQVPYTGGLI